MPSRSPEAAGASGRRAPVFRNGELVREAPSIEEASAHRERELDAFHPGGKRFTNPHRIPSAWKRLYERRTRLIMQGRK